MINMRRHKKYKGKELLFKPLTHLKCEKCGWVQTIDGIVYGTDPVFVGIDRKCKKCGHLLFIRFNPGE